LDHETFKIALAERGIDATDMNKTALHGSQILANDDLIDFARHLDTIGTHEWSLNFVGQKLFMGEVVSIDHPSDYSAFRQEALQRQEELKGYAETVALFVLDLAEDNYDRRKAPAHVEEFVKDILMNLAKQDKTVAEQMFDEKTAERIQAVGILESQGHYAEAQQLWEETRAEAPGGGFCGAGSCGLEGVVAHSKEDQTLRKKMGADDTDTLVKDKERACRCGKKSIVYAYNKSKVIKFCESCGAHESKVSKAA
jgi:hypothetical protein